jgi:hypothetical protein
MSALSAARLLTAGSAWRLTGLTPAGRALVSAVAGPAADDRALAGILLTRAGDRSVPLISEALTTQADPTDLVNVLASIATPQARAALQTATLSTRPEVAAAARQALQTLDQQPRGPG